MPLPKPHKGESKDDFISRCMHEAYGPDAPPDRTQEQAVAMCMSAWRQEHGGEPPKKATVAGIIARWHERFGADPPKAILQLLAKSEPGVPDPEPGEDEDDFIERCVDEVTADDDSVSDDEAESLCEMAWEESGQEDDQEAAFRAPHRRHGNQDVVFKTHAGEVDGAEYVLSDETPDRMGDVIASDGWVLTNFKKNPIALFNHRSDFPIGTWSNLRVEGKALRGHLKIAPEGTSQRIDEIRRLIDAGILRAVSVGFVSVERKPREGKAPSGGYLGDHFTKVELVETSLVSVPANPNALAVAKGLRVSPATIDIVFAETGKRSTRAARRSTGEVATTNGNSRRREPMSLSERIKAAQDRVTALRDKLEEHLKTVDDTNVSDAQLTVTHELNEKIAQEEKGLAALTEAEKHLARTADDGTGRSNGGGGGSRQLATATRAPTGSSRTPFNLPKTKEERMEALIRAGCSQLLAHRLKVSVEEARKMLAVEHRAYDDEATRVLADYSARAASAPAMTTVTGWAAELVQQIWADVMETLLPKSVFPRLAGLGLSLNFGRAGRISIPTRSRTPTIAGSFVGEGAPIPVRQGQFTAQVLTPKKMAVITTWTREIDEHSMPAIEGLLRQAIQEDTAVSLDAILLDTNAATAVRPAGIFNGVAPLTATAGGGLTALVGDIKQISGAILSATQGHIRNMAWLMNPQQILSAGLTGAPNTGVYPFKDEISQGRLMTYPIIDSGTVPLGTVGAIDAADFVAVGSEGPRFEISDQATLHMEDTTPAQIVGGASPGTAAFPTQSLWQTDSLALRLILPMNWTVRRAGVVAWTQGVTW